MLIDLFTFKDFFNQCMVLPDFGPMLDGPPHAEISMENPAENIPVLVVTVQLNPPDERECIPVNAESARKERFQRGLWDIK